MKSLLAFMKKECISQIRSAKLFILLLVFFVFGVMNPVTAKITPWLFEILGETLENSGINIGSVTVSALDSWMQFFKNLPMAMIVFVVLQSGIFTKEYKSGTLVISLTKGLERYKIVVCKAVMLVATWSVLYWLYFGVTYGVTACFWDNGVAQNLALAVVCGWLFGVWVMALIVLFSTFSKGTAGVLLGSGGVVFGMSLVSALPKIGKYFPTILSDGTSLVYGLVSAGSYTAAIVITVVVTIACFVVSVPIFNKKQL